MRFISFAVAAILSVQLPSHSAAATIDLIYQGRSFYCPPSKAYCSGYSGHPGFQGSIQIDSDVYPFESVAGTTLEMTYDWIGEDADMLHLSVTSAGDAYEATIVSAEKQSYTLAQTDPRFQFLSYSGIIPSTLFGIIAPNPSSVRIEITEKLTVASWRFDSGLQGGSNDYSSGPSGDYFASGARSYGPGSWTVLVDGAPVPIPLPAASLLLFSAMSGLTILRSRRRKIAPSRISSKRMALQGEADRL